MNEPLLAEILAIASHAYTEAMAIGPEDGDGLLAFCLEEIRETFVSGSDRATALHEAAIALDNVVDDINVMIAALQAARRRCSPLKSDVIRAFGGDDTREIPLSGQEPSAYLGQPSVPRS